LSAQISEVGFAHGADEAAALDWLHALREGEMVEKA
jgi:hypothetical protein